MKKLYCILFLFFSGFTLYAQCWQTVAAGIDHTIALRPDGTLWAWGFNGSGQLGDGTLETRGVPVQIGTDSNWKAIAAGGNQSFALKNDGTLWAWGDNFWGQLGVGQFGNTKNTPTKVGNATDWKSISAGRSFTMAIKNNGSLWAWGDNMFGTLGIPASVVYSPTQVGTAADWQQVSAGAVHTSAIRTDGTLWAWGSNLFGAVGDGTTTDVTTPTKIGTATDWKEVTAGYGTTHAIKTNGTRWAWGSNASGEFGDGTYDDDRRLPAQIGTDNNWKNISAGINSSLGIKTDGTIWAWGHIIGTYLSNANRRNVPTQISSGTNWQWSVSGDDHSFGLRADGTLWGWGEGTWGKLGDNTWIDNPDPSIISTPIPLGESLQPFCSAATVASLTATGTSIKWYASENGGAPLPGTETLVDGHHYYATRTLAGCESTKRFDVEVVVNLTPTPSPTGESDQTFCGSITVGDLSADGMDIQWYTSSNGGTALPSDQTLANGNHYFASQTQNFCESQQRFEVIFTLETTPPPTINSPLIVCDGTTIAAVISNTNWYLASSGGTKLPIETKIVDGGTYFASNLGTCGESIGRQEVQMKLRKTPPPVAVSNETWISIGGGHGDSEGIRSDGTLWIWGGGYVNSGVTYHYTPRQYGSDATWVSTFYGGNRSILLKNDGGIYLNPGISKIGTQNDWRTATIYGSGEDYHAAAIKTDGTLWAWGNSNTYGQIGDGTYTAKAAPLKIGSATNWKSVSAGFRYTVALANDGTLWAWGNNEYGQLGDGTTTKKNVPTRIGTGTDWESVSSGGVCTMAIKKDGSLWAWGYNDNGNLGDGTTTMRLVPTKIGNSTWRSISAGSMNSLGIKTDGTLWAWGYGNSGALGQGRWFWGNSYVPIQVGTNNDWKAAVAASGYSLALTNDGILWTWGSNERGELGIGAAGNRVDARPISAKQFTCGNPVTLAELPVTGENIQWYNKYGDVVPNTFTIGHESHFYATQTIGGMESCIKLDVMGDNSFPQAPTGPATQNFCDGAVVTDLVPAHTAVKWYDSPTAAVQLHPGVPLYNGREYFAAQTIGVCESKDRLKVKAWVKTQSPPEGPAAQTLCSGARIENLLPSGENIRWYETPDGADVLPVTNELINQKQYFAAQIVDDCESRSRLAVWITVNDPAAPKGEAVQTLCSSATVADLVVEESAVLWYALPTGGLPLSGVTPLVHETVYYAAQVSDACESFARFGVTADLIVTPPPTGDPEQTFTGGKTVEDLIVQGDGIKWYVTSSDADNKTNPVSGEELLLNDANYFATQTLGGCESDEALAVRVSIVLGMESPEMQFDFYPNPVQEFLNINHTQLIDYATVTTLTGQPLITQRVGARDAKLNFSPFANGVYLVQLKVGERMVMLKVTKQ